MKKLNDVPTACSLTTAEFRDREAILFAEFRSAVVEIEELQDGYAFSLRGDGESIALAGKLIMAERECCHFLAFEIVAQPNKGPVVVRVTGPTESKEFLRTILCETGESTRTSSQSCRRHHGGGDATDRDEGI
jgi:hypothetical protein